MFPFPRPALLGPIAPRLILSASSSQSLCAVSEAWRKGEQRQIGWMEGVGSKSGVSVAPWGPLPAPTKPEGDLGHPGSYEHEPMRSRVGSASALR